MADCNTESNICTLPEGEEENDILNLIKEEKIINYVTTVRTATQRGDNFMGIIHAVDITGHDKEQPEKNKNLFLIVKCSPRSAVFRQLIPIKEIFEREIYMYVNYLPELYKIQNIKQIQNGLLPIPKLYKYSTRENDEYLIMENKKAQGFIMLSRKSTLDLDHCKLVLEQLGYLHGLSYVLKFTKLNIFDETIKSTKIGEETINRMQMWLQQFQDSIERALSLINSETEKEVYNKLKNLKDDVPKFFVNCYGFDVDDYSVIIHGDCWTNNILFKYNETGKVEELCFLDWQNSRATSPAVDLSQFIYTCTGTELQNKYFDDMIQIYHNALSKVIQQSGLQVEKCLSFAHLQKEMKKYFKYGVATACLALPMFVSESEEIPDFQNMEHFDESTVKKWNIETKNSSLFEERLRGIIFHAASRDFI